ncbi:MAG TPA: hypothetical protein VIL30_14705 [Ramlibacter sp.]|jgi:hypothetical protein
MNLSTFLKANALAGLIGTLVLSPLLYIYEVIAVGPQSPLLKFDLTDLLMILVAPILMAMMFFVTALAAFPIVVRLERRGLVSFTNDDGQK